MSVSVNGAAQANKLSLISPAKKPGAPQPGGTAKATSGFGNTPAATVSVSAKAVALAQAIKNGHDPDGVQDGK